MRTGCQSAGHRPHATEDLTHRLHEIVELAHVILHYTIGPSLRRKDFRVSSRLATAEIASVTSSKGWYCPLKKTAPRGLVVGLTAILASQARIWSVARPSTFPLMISANESSPSPGKRLSAMFKATSPRGEALHSC